MTIHPSLIEKISLDAREFNADVAADVRRSFAYVGPVTAVAHEAAAGDAAGVADAPANEAEGEGGAAADAPAAGDAATASADATSGASAADAPDAGAAGTDSGATAASAAAAPVAPAAPAVPVCNELRLIVRMSKPYWHDADADGAGAQLWEGVRSWLAGKAYKVGSTIANFNTTRAEAGGQTVRYDHLTLDMKPYELGISLDEGDDLPALDELAARFRDLLAAGVIPADARGVEMPSRASLAEQHVAAEEAARTDADGEAGEPAGANADGEALAGGTDTAGEPEPAEGDPDVADAAATGEDQAADTASACDDAAGEDAGDTAGEDAVAPQACALPHACDGLASIDYTHWDVTLADGSVRELDSVAGAWC